MAKDKKTKRKKTVMRVRLVSSEKTGYFYVTSRNPRNTVEKFKFRKYDPVLRRHVIFNEERMK